MSHPRHQVPAPLRPYVLVFLDGFLARYAGVSPDEPIGEPVTAAVEAVLGAMDRGHQVKVLTWREPGLVYAWMERAKLQEWVERSDFEVTTSMPRGLPLEVWTRS